MERSAKRVAWAAALSMAVAVMAACGSPGAQGPAQQSPETPAVEPLPILFELRLDVPAEARLGGTLPLKLRLKNRIGLPITLPLGGDPPHDFVVTNAEGSEVWRWTFGKVVTLLLVLKPLAGGEEIELEGQWSLANNEGEPVPPGTYSVRGTVHAGDPVRLLETAPSSVSILR